MYHVSTVLIEIKYLLLCPSLFNSWTISVIEQFFPLGSNFNTSTERFLKGTSLIRLVLSVYPGNVNWSVFKSTQGPPFVKNLFHYTQSFFSRKNIFFSLYLIRCWSSCLRISWFYLGNDFNVKFEGDLSFLLNMRLE